MDNKKYWFFGSKLNTALLLILIILMVIALKWMYENKEIYIPDQRADENIQQQILDNQTNWKKSPKFGLYYQNNLNIIEYYQDKSGKETSEVEGQYPTFTATWGPENDSVISWGGYWGNNGSSCQLTDFGTFKYGASSVACLKGLRTSVAHFSARNSITKEDLKIFGDFVLKNQ